MRVLIVGAGIAGPTLAYWLRRFGHEPTLLEHAPAPRRGGYLIDFWGTGFQVADEMGLTPRLLADGYRVRELREVAADGRRVSGFDPRRVIDRLGGHYVSIARADLAAAILDAVQDDVETIFGDTVEALLDIGDRVHVTFRHAGPREFDLVVGADGLHSRVRELAFPPGSWRERDLGIAVAVYDVAGYEPTEELVAVTHTEVGSQALRFTLRDGATMFCFTFRNDLPLPNDDTTGRAFLRGRLSTLGWEVPAMLDFLEDARTFYLDKASQVLLPDWSRGRVALVGDAGACPSLLAGQGAALAMVESYVLAVELQRHPRDPAAAFAAWQARLGGVVRRKQDAAVRLGAAFAPGNRWELGVRSLAMRFLAVPVVARLAVGRSLRDPIELP